MPRVLYDPLMHGPVLKLPTDHPYPTQYIESEVASVSGANYTIYEVPADGYYRVTVCAAGGRTSEATAGGAGGKTTQTVFLFKGTKCLLWSSATGTNRYTGGLTGYPAVTDQVLGGTGATGHSEGGGGGGSPTNHGRNASHTDGGSGSGGAGFIAGINRRITPLSHQESQWSRALSSLESWKAGSVYRVWHAYSYILAGGGSGGCGHNDDVRTAGGGGGAWGNGGPTSYSTVVARTTGPGGEWGQGSTGGRYGGGVTGAWAVLDFSRTQFDWGRGGGSGTNTNGWCNIVRIQEFLPVTFSLDMGHIVEPAPISVTQDAGPITGTVSTTKDAGAITGTVSATHDAGSIMALPSDLDDFDMGYVYEDPTRLFNMGTLM